LSVACVVALNLLALTVKAYGLLQFTATATLFFSLYPTWRFLRTREDNFPFFPLIALLYGVYYSIMAFLPFDPYPRYVDVAQGSLLHASAVSLVGIAILVAGYYRFSLPLGFQTFSLRWAASKAQRLGIAAGLFGTAMQVMRMTREIPPEWVAIIYLLAQLAVLGIGILFYLFLEGRLSLSTRLFLWAVLVPSQLLTELSSGFVFPVVRMTVYLTMIYVAVRRLLPWRLAFAVFVFLVPSMVFKSEYRKLAWSEGKSVSASFSELMRGGFVFTTTILSAVRETGSEGLYYGGQTVAHRLDLLYPFAFVMELTPRDVPYLDGASYSALFWKPLPRVFFPDKPRETWGNEFGQRYGLLDPDDQTTSLNMPQMMEMYVNFGILGVIVGMWLLSQLFKTLNHVLNARRAGEWWTVAGALVLSSLINIESNLLLVFGGIIQLVVLLYLLGLLVRAKGAAVQS